ncbi:MAG: peptidoglycan DD-metalloendopeptidase family protein [Gammaproteobacteria bacterium]|nr:peptidoglycan DD-metalloendopeptidase family protein [Gammaproteobacteria bacterium]
MNRFWRKRFSVVFKTLCLSFLVSCGSFVHHQVRPGETLYSIGWKYNVDFRMLAEWNDIESPYVIHEGQWIRVVPPLQEERPAEPPPGPNDIARLKKRLTKKEDNTQQRPSTSGTIENTPENTAQSPSDVREESGINWIWPTNGQLIKRFSVNELGKKGIDIAGELGQDIFASANGKVVYSGSGIIGLGNLVIIKHNKTYLSAYAHNQKLLVKEGETVQQGQIIAKMGDTGTERILLHFEIRKNGKPVNPLHYLTENNNP